MQELTGKDKIQQICDALKKETIEPAKKKRKEIIENAQIEAKTIVEKANQKADNIIKEAEKKAKERNDQALSALKISARQTLDLLKQEIEKKFFSKNLIEKIEDSLKDPNVIVDIIKSIVQSIEKEGIDTDISVFASKAIDVKNINTVLGKNILDKLKEKELVLTDIQGVKVKIYKNNVVIDMTAKSLFDLISGYLREDFRKMMFL